MLLPLSNRSIEMYKKHITVHEMMKTKITAKTISIVLMGIWLSACNTTPTAPSSSSPSSSPSTAGSSAPSPGSPQSSSPARTTSSQGQQQNTASNKTGSDTSSGQQTTANSGQQGEQTSNPANSAESGTTTTSTSTKTDDEILADALKAFEGQSRQQTTNTESQQTGSPGTAQTEGEKADQLNDELNEKFAKFDRLMLSEREAVRNESNREGGGRSVDTGSGNGVFGDEDGDLEALRTATASPPPPIRNRSQRRGDENIDADVQSERNVPEDLASTEGDDIIAKQLREAAMKEPDPELREKLWDEYRKYKKSL